MFISKAHAAAEGAAQGGGFEMLIMLGMFAVIFYFMIYRPQSKRVKEHKNLIPTFPSFLLPSLSSFIPF